jgi:hypothetical protein
LTARRGGMFNDIDKSRVAARAVTGFFAGALSTGLNRVLVRFVEVWPVFHFKSGQPMEMLLAQDFPFMAKASLIFGVIYGIFCACVPRHLVPATVLLMGVLVLAGRAYIYDGLQLGAVYDDALWIVLHVVVRTVLLLLFYWLLREFIGKRFAGPY